MTQSDFERLIEAQNKAGNVRVKAIKLSSIFHAFADLLDRTECLDRAEMTDPGGERMNKIVGAIRLYARDNLGVPDLERLLMSGR